jgi:two-component system sensor histidine kinase PhoQ
MSIPVKRELDRLVEGLAKVYRDKSPQIDLDVAADIRFRGDSGDFLELAGNLLDNACKWCRRRVLLTVRKLDSGVPGAEGLQMIVEDDGPGIPEEAAEVLLQRGMRLDESAPGHGIGLAVVKEIAASYGGLVTITKSELGGARISVDVRPSAKTAA